MSWENNIENLATLIAAIAFVFHLFFYIQLYSKRYANAFPLFHAWHPNKTYAQIESSNYYISHYIKYNGAALIN